MFGRDNNDRAWLAASLVIVMRKEIQQAEADPHLRECWQAVRDGQEGPYLPEERVVEWCNRVLAVKGIMSQTAGWNINKQLNVYVKETHQLEPTSINNLQLKWDQAVQFFLWLNVRMTKMQPTPVHAQQPNEELGQQRSGSINHNYQTASESAVSKNKSGLGNSSKLNQPNHQIEPVDGDSSALSKQQLNEVNQKQKQVYLYPSGQMGQEQENQFAEGSGPVVEQEGNKQIGKNYQEYLSAIFDHYCRMSYATGNDPTFQQIQQKTQVMTINKFMIFCKDFAIVKLNSITRHSLVEIFKKNSECYKEMNFDQFLTVLLKISYLVYSPDSEEPPTQKSRQFEQLLLFLEVNNFAAFRKKIQLLNISYRGGQGPQGQVRKVVPANYKFKFIQESTPPDSDPKEQLEERKRIKSENKLKVVEKRLRNVSSKKQMIKVHGQTEQQQVKSTQQNRKLAPPVPPARKISHLGNSKPAQQTVTGYANIHKLKLLEKQGQAGSKMKLNSIVEEAKKMMDLQKEGLSEYPTSNRASTYGRETPYSSSSHKEYHRVHTNADYNRADSELSNSQRDLLEQSPIGGHLSHRRSYAPHGHQQLERRAIEKQAEPELEGIIGNQSDEDEYLEEHLNREKKTGQINERIQRKIKEFQLKSLPN